MYTKFGAEERLPSGMRDMGDVVQTFGPAPSHHEWQNGIRQAQSWVNWIDHSSYTKMTVTMMIQICIPFYHILSLLSSEDLPSNPPPPSFPVPPPLIYTIHFATPQITDMNHSISFKTYSPGTLTTENSITTTTTTTMILGHRHWAHPHHLGRWSVRA